MNNILQYPQYNCGAHDKGDDRYDWFTHVPILSLFREAHKRCYYHPNMQETGEIARRRLSPVSVQKKKTYSPFQECLSGNDKPKRLHSSGRLITPCLPKQWAMQESGRKVKCIPGLSCAWG